VGRAEGELAEQLRQLQVTHDERRPPLPPAEPPSLAVAARRGKPSDAPDAETVTGIRNLAVRYAMAKEPRGEDPDVKKGVEELLKKLTRPEDLGRAAFEAATRQRPTKQLVQFLVYLLDKAKARPFPETRVLVRLAGLPDKDWPAEEAVLALRVAWEAEEADATDTRADAWLQEARQKAAGLREKGQKLLFTPDPVTTDLPAPALEEALRTYQSLNRDARTVSAALRTRDEALSLLAGYEASLEFDGTPEPDWEKAVDQACRLREALVVPGPAAGGTSSAARSPRPAAEVQRCHEAVLDALAHLPAYDPNDMNSSHQPVGTEYLKRLIDPSATRGSADARVAALLETPWPRAPQRSELWSAHDALAAAREQQRPSDLAGRDEPADVRKERQRALARARRSVTLLRLHGQEVEGPDRALRQADERPEDPARMQGLAEALRRAWARLRTPE
jgi:hypothetical protein